MKKAKVLTLILIIAIMAMGAGYAYWSEVLVVKNTVTTGELNVQFTKSCSTDYDNKFPGWQNYLGVSDQIVDNNHKIKFNITDIYPGSGAYLGFKIENMGTVPAKATITSNITAGAAIKDDFDYSIDSIILYKPVKKTISVGNWEWDFVKIDVTGELGKIEADTFDEFIAGLNARLGQYTLEPRGYFEINNVDKLLDGTEVATGYNIELPGSITDDALEVQSFNFDLLLKFDQVN